MSHKYHALTAFWNLGSELAQNNTCVYVYVWSEWEELYMYKGSTEDTSRLPVGLSCPDFKTQRMTGTLQETGCSRYDPRQQVGKLICDM